MLENLVLLRFVEGESRLRRALAVLKMCDSAFDSSLRELIVDDNGIRVGGEFGQPLTQSLPDYGPTKKPARAKTKPPARKQVRSQGAPRHRRG
jgi:circadian clock protein KaiC